MKKFLILFAALFAAIAMTACGPEQGEPLVTKDGEVTGVPDVAVQPDSTLPADSTDTVTEPSVSTDATSEEPQTAATEPSVTASPEPTSTEPTSAEPTTVSEKKTEPTTSTKATTPKATDPPATTPAPDEDDDDVEELVDEIINVDEYWALLGIEDEDLSTDVQP